MSLTINLPSNTITIEESTLALTSIRDLPSQQRIIAHVKKVPLAFVVWDGSTEYAAASAWTNESILARATELLTLSADSIQWIY